MWIDPSINYELSLLLVYNATWFKTAYNIDQISYGSLASTFTVSKPSIPAYINFTEPTTAFTQTFHNRNKSSGNDFQWIYFYPYMDTNRTLVAVYNLDHSKAAHYNLSSFQLAGTYSLMASSLRCLLIN